MTAEWGCHRDKLAFVQSVFKATPNDFFGEKSGYPNKKANRVTNGNEPHNFRQDAVS